MSRAEPPSRGDIVKMNFDPGIGHEQAGFRPAVVISHTIYNRNSSTIVVCPITGNVGAWPFKVELPAGLPIKGAVLVDQIKTVDWRSRRARFACTCPSDILDEIDMRLDVLFRGISPVAVIG